MTDEQKLARKEIILKLYEDQKIIPEVVIGQVDNEKDIGVTILAPGIDIKTGIRILQEAIDELREKVQIVEN